MTDPQNPNQAIDMMSGITTTHVVLMILLAIAAIATIWWGTVLARRRRNAQDQVDENFAIAEEHGAVSEPNAALDAPARVSEDVPVLGPEPMPMPAASQVQSQFQASAPAEAPIASDLTQIKGLGPKLAATLAEQGITRVEQIAALTPERAEALDATLGTFRGRLARDRWIEQAKLLSAGDRAGYEAAFGKLGG